VDVQEVPTQSENAHIIETHIERPEIPDLNAPGSDANLGYERTEENSMNYVEMGVVYDNMIEELSMSTHTSLN